MNSKQKRKQSESNESAFLSIKQAAAECNISVQSMRSWCAKNGVSRGNNRWQMTQDDLDKAKEYYLRNQDTKRKRSESNESAFLSAFHASQLDILHEQLREKDRQIAELQAALNLALETNKGLSASNAVIAVAGKKAVLEEGKSVGQRSVFHRIKEALQR